MMLNHLDLFSGIGGFALAARWVGGIRTIGFCDNEKYARQILAKNFPGVPIYEDVRELHPDVIVSRDGRIDFLTCGFPCQDLSIAGNQKGIEAERSGLFFEITRLSDEILAYCGVRPSLVLENVPNLLAGDGGSWARAVYGELAVRGYCVEWKIVSASDVGAPHQRKRWWAVCYMANASSNDARARLCDLEGKDGKTSRSQMQHKEKSGQSSSSSKSVAHTNRNGTIRDQSKDWQGSWTEQICEDVAHPKSQLGNGFDDHPGGCMGSESISELGNGGWEENLADTYHWKQKNRRNIAGMGREQQSFPWNRGRLRESELRLGGMVDGIPDWLDEPGDIPRVTTGQKNRVARLKGLGNAVVPQCAMIPLMRLKEILT